MTSSVRAFRSLVGDALIAAGVLVRGNRTKLGIDETLPWADPRYILPAFKSSPIPRDTIRSALDELPDSKLLRIAATIIAGWRPLLVRDHVAALTDVDLLIETLRDRATQFEAIESDAAKPFLTTANLLETLRTTDQPTI